MAQHKASLKKILLNLKNKNNFVFLDNSKVSESDSASYLFQDPIEIISTNNLANIISSLKVIEDRIKKGYFAAGFLSYEIGFGFEKSLKTTKKSNFPYLWFGIYKKPTIYSHKDTMFTDDISENRYSIENLKPNISEKEYTSSIKRIKHFIEKGDTYQVNYTFMLDFKFKGSIEQLYLALRQKQHVPYSALIKFNNQYILSFSPELFLKKRGSNITVKPMKGTAFRGRTTKEDKENIKALSKCSKNRSENIMIVDLLRNDLGRVCKTDSVKTTKFFEVEKYESILQMTSTVEGKMRSNALIADMFKATAPSGSVTGAPKISSMRIIDKLEKHPRKIYTGNIGFITPKKDATFNVAIRTLLIDSKTHKAQMGIGSGIVYDSGLKSEYNECILKSDFLTSRHKDFFLIETLLCDSKKGYPLLKYHILRLENSAEYFNFLCNKTHILECLNRVERGLNKAYSYRVRLLLDRDGNVSITYKPIKLDTENKLVTISNKRVLSEDRFLFHKTTNRNFYDKEYKLYKKKSFYDVIFENEKNQITEGAISNIIIKKNNRYYTPPIECGLLNGVYRRYLMSKKGFNIKEKVLYRKDLKKADQIILTNAVRGMVKVCLKK